MLGGGGGNGTFRSCIRVHGSIRVVNLNSIYILVSGPRAGEGRPKI